jgi:hypothetical protein
MKTLKLILLISAVFTIACSPTEFYLNMKSEHVINGENLSTIESLDVTGENHLTMFPGSKIALRVPLISLLIADFTVDLQQGEGIKFYIRTIINNFENRDMIEFDYTTHGSIIRDKNNILATADSVTAQLNQPKRIKIKNDGPVVCITVDCDTVYSGRSKLNCTEFVIIETMQNSKARLYGINFAETEFIKKTLDVLLKTIKEDY